jgi:peptide subunit release factor 1 (eRF1)
MNRVSIPMLDAARAELACPECHNDRRGSFRGFQWDECRTCHGEGRNVATIALLEALVDHATGYVRKVMR